MLFLMFVYVVRKQLIKHKITFVISTGVHVICCYTALKRTVIMMCYCKILLISVLYVTDCTGVPVVRPSTSLRMTAHDDNTCRNALHSVPQFASKACHSL